MSGTVTVPEVTFGADGLVPAVVQDVADGRVLMVAWMDAEALAATVASGEVHFHSRSRDRLWRKGETSGNVLRLVRIEVDCDGDALLVTADPAGPTCHRGTRSCFDADGRAGRTRDPGFRLARGAVGDDRRTRGDPTGRLVHRCLLADGVDAVARKVTEEATEVLIAAKDDAVAEASGVRSRGNARRPRRRDRRPALSRARPARGTRPARPPPSSRRCAPGVASRAASPASPP